MEHFYFISDYGKINLTDKELNNKELVLVLDSSVCIDIINLVKWKKNAHCDKTKIYNLIDFIQKYKIQYITLFALLESCYDRTTLEINSEKYFDFQNMIEYAFQFPLKKFKNFQYDFYTDCLFFNNPNLKSNIVKQLIDERINLYYVALLKISTIAQRSMSSNKSENNFEEFMQWMINDLDVILGIEYSLALEIFGGNTKLRSMIKLGAKKEKILKACWSSAWDLFHSRISCNKEQISKLIDKDVKPIFVTKDSYLFELISPEVHYFQKFETSKVSILNKNPQVMNYSEDFLDKINKQLLELVQTRVYKRPQFEIENIISMIKELEVKIQ